MQPYCPLAERWASRRLISSTSMKTLMILLLKLCRVRMPMVISSIRIADFHSLIEEGTIVSDFRISASFTNMGLGFEQENMPLVRHSQAIPSWP